jgi:hypothetical protein
MNEPVGIAMFTTTSIGFVGAEAESAVTAGNVTSPISQVSVPPVVAPDPTVDQKMRATVAVVAVPAADAAGFRRTRETNEPFVPAVNALKTSVATVPVPIEFVFAAVTLAAPTFGTSVKIGEVFAGI